MSTFAFRVKPRFKVNTQVYSGGRAIKTVVQPVAKSVSWQNGVTREFIILFEDNLPDATPINQSLHDCID